MPQWPAIQHLSFPVSDVRRAATFYRDFLGFTEVHVADGIAELSMGATKLVLLRATEAVSAPAKLHFGFRGANAHEVDEWADRARSAGATIESGPERTEWGGYALYLRDPDGYLIELWADH